MKNFTSYFIVTVIIAFFSVGTASAASANLALGKHMSAKVNDMNGAQSNEKDAGLMVDGDENTYWESANSFKHSIVIDLGSKYKVTKIVVKWADGQAANTMTFKFGDTKESVVQVLSRKDMTETVESVFENFDENSRFIEILLHGRIVSSKPYRIKEIEIYGEDNIALLKPVSARVSSTTGDPSNDEFSHYITDGDFNTYWESPASYKHSILIDLGEKKKFTRVVIKWADECASSSIDLSVGDTKENLNKFWSRNQLTETVESVFDNLDEEGQFFELMVRGRILDTYRIREIEIYDDNANKHINTPEEQASIDKITERLTAGLLSGQPSGDRALMFANSMLEDGSWEDVDYADEISIGGWSPMSHLNRLREMAMGYSHPESTAKDDAFLLTQIKKGLLFFKGRLPKSSDNWWYNEIGAPEKYMEPVLLIKGKIAENEMRLISSYLKDKIDSYWGQAKNLAYVTNIALYKGCAEDNFSIVAHAFDAYSSTLTIVDKDGAEGIRPDWSFHQHHTQLYSGGYGSSLISDIVESMNLCEGTLFMDRFTPEKMDIFRNLLFEGNLLLSYRHAMDFGARGRNISRDPNTNYTTISKSDLNSMIINDPEYASSYQAWLDFIDNKGASPKAGVNKFFWKSNIITEHGENYYLSAKIISDRSYGTEALNGENIKAFNLPMGATNIMTTGDEYDRIFPVWDWTRIPGTTAVQNQDFTKLDGYIIGTNKFGGGSSDGINGVIAYDHDYLGLKARKSYFFFDDMMFCMGSGINFTDNESVATSVNQSLLSGEVVVNNGSEEVLADQSSQNFDNLKWVHHNNVGYIFPSSAKINVQNKEQTGSWKDINTTASATVINKDIFSVWFDHGNAPSDANYQYVVVPGKSLAEFKAAANDHGFIISQNDASAQALRKGTKYGIIFYEPCTVTMDDGLAITSDKAAIVLITATEGTYDISVSDPTYSQDKITLTVNEELEAVSRFAAGESNTVLEFILPKGNNLGSTITNSYRRGPVGIEEDKNGSSSYVYYSRSQGGAKVGFTAENYDRLEVLDLNGKIVSRASISQNQTSVNIQMTNCAVGVYFVKLSGKNNVETLKFIITK